MVVSNTGFSIPIVFGLLANKYTNFKPNSAFNFSSNPEKDYNYFPSDINRYSMYDPNRFKKSDDEINREKSRFIDQAYTWSNEINKSESELGNKANGLFLGLEGGKIDTSKLPKAQELLDAGITKVVYLNNGDESADLSSKNTSYLRDYFTSLEKFESTDKKKFEVFYKGLETRNC